MATITLTTCNNAIEANLIKGMLENNGIRCFLTNENFSSLMPQFNGMMGAGIQIMIDNSDFDTAQKLILSLSKVNEIVCPNCSSTNVKFGLGTNKIIKILTIIISLFAAIPFGNIRNTYYCQECKTEFKK